MQPRKEINDACSHSLNENRENIALFFPFTSLKVFFELLQTKLPEISKLNFKDTKQAMT